MKKRVLISSLSLICGFTLLGAILTPANVYIAANSLRLNNANGLSTELEKRIPVSTKSINVNSTWEDDVWSQTEGYYYVPNTNANLHPNKGNWGDTWKFDSSSWVFSLTNNGFKINKPLKQFAYVSNAKVSGIVYQVPNADLNAWMDSYSKIEGDFTLNSSKRTINTTGDTSTIDFTNNVQQQKINLNGREPSSLNNTFVDIDIKTNPFISFKVPLPSYELEYTGLLGWYNWGSKRWEYNNYNEGPFVNIGLDRSHTSKIERDKNNYYAWGVSDNKFVANFYSDDDDFSEWSNASDRLDFTVYLGYTSVSLFNDYDFNTLKGTHMTKNGSNFNSSFSEFKIDEKLFDKTNLPSEEYKKLGTSKIATVVGKHIGYDFVRGAEFSVSLNDETGAMGIIFKPKYWFQNGTIVPYTGSGLAYTVEGFSSSLTKITKIASHPSHITIDKWKTSVFDSTTGLVTDRSFLSQYLFFDHVPVNAELYMEILGESNKLGTISFNIYSTKIMDKSANIVSKRSNTFTFDLQLESRVTSFSAKNSGYRPFFADEAMNTLFTNNKLNTAEFLNYYDIFAPAENANYFLIPETYKYHTGDGNVEFKVYADQYYNSEAELARGSTTQGVFDVKIAFKSRKSIVEEKTNIVPTIRVDHFTRDVVNADGSIKNMSLFNEYVKTEHLPSNSVLAIQDVELGEFNSDDYNDIINFNIIASKFNKIDDGAPHDNVSIPITLKLLPQYKPTDAIVKDTFTNPDRIDIFKNKIESLEGNELTTYVKQYVDFTSLRADANVTANISNYDAYNGNLKLNLQIENYYDHVSNEQTGKKNINGLIIHLTPAPTEVKVITAKDRNIRLDRFVKEFADVNTGVVTDKDFLKNYVSFDAWDPDTTITIDLASIVMINATGEWSAKLILGDANDINSQRVTNKEYPIAFTFAEKYDPTTIDQMPQYPLIQMDDFESSLFDENGYALPAIFDYIDAYSLPPGAKIKLVKKPIIDYPNAQLTIEVEITSFYDADSDLQVPGTRATPFVKTFTFDLLSPETSIAAKESYDVDSDKIPRVDRFASSIKNLTNDDLKTALANYVNFDFLPANVELSIDPNTFEIINIPGTLNFNIVASRHFDAAGYLRTVPELFKISLNLGNKYATTEITAKDQLPAQKLRVDRFIAALGASEVSPEITNLNILEQYVNVISLPANTKLEIDYAEHIDIDIDTGVLSFSIKVKNYYDFDSDLRTTGFSFPITLNLTALDKPTTITAKTTGHPDIRVDRFLKTFMDTTTNKVTNLEVLKQYVDIVSLPAFADLYVTQINSNGKTGAISFNLIATSYYDVNSDLQSDSLNTNAHPFAIALQLSPKIDPTNFIAKPILPNDILVNELTAYIMPNGVLSQARFEQYVEIVSLPENAKMVVEEVSYSLTTGEVVYNIKVDKYHDTIGDLQLKSKTYNVVLNLNKVHPETQIYALSKYPNDLDVTKFKQYVEDVNGVINKQNLTKFVGIESLPSTSVLTINWGDETNTKIDFTIHASQYYNAQHRLANDKDYEISLSFTNQATKTEIKAWPTYPKTNAAQFFNTINPNDVIDFTQLSKYVDFTTAPYDSILTISNEKADINTGIVSFDITTNAWYNENLERQNNDKTFRIVLNLAPKHAETNLFGYASVDKKLTLDEFWLLISTDNALDQTKLSQYVNLDTLANNTQMQYLNAVKNWNGSISFDLVVDRFYDVNGVENFGKKVFKITLNNLEQSLHQKTVTDYTWLYVVIALIGSVGIGLIWFLIVKNKKQKEENKTPIIS